MVEQAGPATPIPPVIGIDVGGTGTKGAIVDVTGRILDRVDRHTDVTSGTKGIIAVVDELLQRADGPIGAVGIGAAGFIDSQRGAVLFSPNLTYDDPNIADAVRARTGLPVIVDNDANAAAWGEYVFGSARGAAHVAFITLGTGIGSGFVIEGRLVRGYSGAAAELGHMVIDPDGPPCPCGLRGCLEQLASGTAIARMARASLEQYGESSILDFAGSVDAVTAEHVAMAARQYDELARDVMRQAGRYLGIGLSNVVNLFDPEVIVLGGSVARAGEPYLGPARDRLVEMTAAQRRRPMRLDVTSMVDGGIVGAAALALHNPSIGPTA